MNRKSPKRIGDQPTQRLTTQRLIELVDIITSDTYLAGSQDEIDVLEALRELVDRRNAEVLRERLVPRLEGMA